MMFAVAAFGHLCKPIIGEEAAMVPYRVSAWVPSTTSASGREFKLYGTFAESDDAALSTVSRVVSGDWQIYGVEGVLSRAEVEALRLAHGEVRELQSLGR